MQGRILYPATLKRDILIKRVYLLKDPQHLIIVEQDVQDLSKARIIYTDKLKDVEVMIDLSNPRALVVASKLKVKLLNF
jgi:hypothetical protein